MNMPACTLFNEQKKGQNLLSSSTEEKKCTSEKGVLPETAPKGAGSAVLGTPALKISRGTMPLISLEQIAQAMFCLGVWDLQFPCC